ncbi:MAG: hypothetical protein WCI02_07690 [Planctomycetota bacterium]|jgi:hypothetical protein
MIDWPTLPDLGVFLAWPERGLAAFHPDDAELAQTLIPSDRVFERTAFDGTYYRIQYGSIALRIQPSMWLSVRDEGLRIGDQVEVRSRMLQNDPCIASIMEMRYASSKGVILYTLSQSEMPNPKLFEATDLIAFGKYEPLRPPDFSAPTPRDLDPRNPSPSDDPDEARLKFED